MAMALGLAPGGCRDAPPSNAGVARREQARPLAPPKTERPAAAQRPPRDLEGAPSPGTPPPDPGAGGPLPGAAIPAARRCQTDSECVGEREMYRIQATGACCRGCNTQALNKDWAATAVAECASWGADGCPQRQCRDPIAGVACKAGACVAVPVAH